MDQQCDHCGTSGLPEATRFCGVCLAPLREERQPTPLDGDDIELVGRQRELSRLLAMAKRAETGRRQPPQIRHPSPCAKACSKGAAAAARGGRVGVLKAANEIFRACGMQPVPAGFFERVAADGGA